MTARIVAHNAKRSPRLHPMDDRKFNGDHSRVWRIADGVPGQLWSRIAEGKRRDG